MLPNLRLILPALAVVPALALADTAAPAPHEKSNHTAIVTHTRGGFTYRSTPPDRFAIPLPSPLSQPQYAPHYAQAKTLLPTTVTYTTYALTTATPAPTDNYPYGQSAYNALWAGTTYPNALPFTTTAAATPLPSSELVFPPPLPGRAASPADGLKFPKEFMWGVAGSAWQVEGGLQFGGRGPATLDALGAGLAGGPGSPSDANVADMHYFLYRQDIARLAALGVPTYSFSISWARVVPFGVANSPVNEEALAHYEDVINTCVQYGVTPVVTLLHLDPPTTSCTTRSKLWPATATRVPVWFTLNEPNNAVPYISPDYNVFAAQLRAHAMVYRWYKDVLKGTGRISFKVSNLLAVPLDTSNPDDVAAALRYQEFVAGVMSRPVFLGEQIPSVVLNTPGLSISPLSAEDLALIKGTADFFAFDPYVAQFATAPPNGCAACAANKSDPLWPSCVELSYVQRNGWLIGAASNSYPHIAPQYVREQLGYVWKTYGQPAGGVMITEFGLPVTAESTLPLAKQLMDFDRSMYYVNFLAETLRAVHHDGVKVIGALAWSFLDNNEFGSYADQYGLQYVNRTSPALERRFKRSIFDFVDFFHQHVEK
ncbi:beta-glucosidase [Zopfochytrium polystomum]|nr:beta-glucosidase [Zopfochytrium polystomum]